MELQRIKELVLSKGTKGVVPVKWDEIEPLLDSNVDSPNKKNRFKMKLKPELSGMGLDIKAFVGNNVQFIVKESESSQPAPKKRATTKTKISKSKVSQADEVPDYFNLAEDNAGDGTEFGHSYIFPAEFEYVKFAVESPSCFPLLVGDKSAGKSRMCEEIAKRLDRHDWEGNVIGKGVPCFRICLEEIEEATDLVGSTELVTNPETQTSETVFVPGILLEAWVKGWILIMDEVDRSSKEARQQFNMITEIGSRLMVKTHKGFKFFRKHPDCTFVFTANTWGHGDFTGEYDGAEPLNSAWLSRIGPKFEVKTDFDIFRAVLEEYNLPQPVLHLLFEHDGGCLPAMQDVLEKEKLNESIALRWLIRFATVYPKFGWHFGFETCVINEFKEFTREKMRRTIEAKTGIEFKPTSNLREINSEKVQSALRQAGL